MTAIIIVVCYTIAVTALLFAWHNRRRPRYTRRGEPF